MEKFKFKEVFSFLREKFRHQTDKRELDQEYQKERKSAQTLQVNRNFGSNKQDPDGNRDISAI